MANTKKKTTKKNTTVKNNVKEEKELEKVEEVEEEIEERVEKKTTTKKSNLKGIIIAVICVAAFVGLSLLLPSNGSNKKNNNPKYSVSDWLTDIEGKTVVTVLASKTCPHCQEYKPVVTQLSQEHDFLLYFFELEDLTTDEQNVVMSTFDIDKFDGGVPFTFIVKDDKVVAQRVGYSDKDTIVAFFKENGLIK